MRDRELLQSGNETTLPFNILGKLFLIFTYYLCIINSESLSTDIGKLFFCRKLKQTYEQVIRVRSKIKIGN